MSTKHISIHWFRKGLRLHDNPALLDACKRSIKIYPIFCIDPYFAKPDIVGINRYSFLLECLIDLDHSLRKIGSRLYVLRGKPEDEIPLFARQHGVSLMTFESDSEPYARQRDSRMIEILKEQDIICSLHCSHTLHNLDRYTQVSKGSVSTYASFCKLFDSLGQLREELAAPNSSMIPVAPIEDLNNKTYDVLTLPEMGYHDIPTKPFLGGETEALLRLERMVTNPTRASWVRGFAKPETPPNSLEPSTTVLSPYLKFGCLSSVKMYNHLTKIVAGHAHTAPPVSLHGQLLWREFFYYSSYITPNFDKMVGNTKCKQIPWQRDAILIKKWEMGETGYPFIDAIMHQLRCEGWIHHLARHAVACFLTRGDLWQHWEEGVRVFDLYLLDDDWALNNANWQWLSASNFFYQYFRVYSPVAFGKKTDPSGAYIRKWIPQLRNYPDKFIFEPWLAPQHIQKTAGCIIGVDYPLPIVDHSTASKENMNKMKLAYDNSNSNNNTKGTIDSDVNPATILSSGVNNSSYKDSNTTIDGTTTSPTEKKKRKSNTATISSFLGKKSSK